LASPFAIVFTFVFRCKHTTCAHKVRPAKSCGKLEKKRGQDQMSAASFSAKLSAIVLPDADERPVRLGSLWESQPAVIVFLRHYG
jgi:hypothetical protein